MIIAGATFFTSVSRSLFLREDLSVVGFFLVLFTAIVQKDSSRHTETSRSTGSRCRFSINVEAERGISLLQDDSKAPL